MSFLALLYLGIADIAIGVGVGYLAGLVLAENFRRTSAERGGTTYE
ncbi:MAG: hypothetical protein KGL39_36815 [Patescibacteria group bacterium]|nr:hypothetical protein [Patescibacteria group bacterium]